MPAGALRSAVPKVSFLVIGAQKAGTTVLDHYLRQHPDIGMADVKEVHYFDDEIVFEWPEGDSAAYESRFPGTKALHGESTPIYLWWKPACQRIHRYNPDMKLIAILRDPVDRAFSHWNMEFNRGDEHRDFRSAVQAELEQRTTDPDRQHRVFSYLSRGFYTEQIERFQRTFDPQQLLCVKYEDLRDDPEPQLTRIFDHIGASRAAYRFAPMQLNPGNYSTSLDAGTKRELKHLFADDIRRAEKLLAQDLGAWL